MENDSGLLLQRGWWVVHGDRELGAERELYCDQSREKIFLRSLENI